MRVMGSRIWNFRVVVLLLGLLLFSCGGDRGGAGSSTTDATTDTTSAETTAAETTAAGETTTTAEEGGGEPEQTTLQIVVAPPEFDSLVDALWIRNLEEAGITVETVDFEFGPDTIRALASGAGAIASTSPTPAMRFIQESGSAVKVIAAELLNTDYILLVTEDIQTVEDLRGKKIGISEPGDISDSTTRLMLEGHPDLDISDVEIVQIGGTGARIAALTADEIQGGPVHAADGLAAAEATGTLHPLLNYWEFIPIYAQRYIVADPTWLTENPNLAQLAIDTLIDAQRQAKEDKEGFVALGQELIPDMSVEIMESTYDFFRDGGFFAVNGGLEAIGPTNEADLSIGLIDEIPPESEWLDPSFVEDYLARNGEQ
jgi:ABC-type nitrate/sulfonate/bicarbonate transport system substrate-binding protein